MKQISFIKSLNGALKTVTRTTYSSGAIIDKVFGLNQIEAEDIVVVATGRTGHTHLDRVDHGVVIPLSPKGHA